MFQVLAYTLVGLASAGFFYAAGWHAGRRRQQPWQLRQWRDRDSI
jgi:hypothetical protein